jgi:serine protease inhibitor
MGIVDLFNDADLSAMSSSAISNRLKVSNVFHQATIEVNEGGSEASAASGN